MRRAYLTDTHLVDDKCAERWRPLRSRAEISRGRHRAWDSALRLDRRARRRPSGRDRPISLARHRPCPWTSSASRSSRRCSVGRRRGAPLRRPADHCRRSLDRSSSAQQQPGGRRSQARRGPVRRLRRLWDSGHTSVTRRVNGSKESRDRTTGKRSVADIRCGTTRAPRVARLWRAAGWRRKCLQTRARVADPHSAQSSVLPGSSLSLRSVAHSGL